MEPITVPSKVTDNKHSHKSGLNDRCNLQRPKPAKIGRADLLVAAAAAYDDDYFRVIEPQLRALGSPANAQRLNRDQGTQASYPLPNFAAHTYGHSHATQPTSAFVRKLQRLQSAKVQALASKSSSAKDISRGDPVLSSAIGMGIHAPPLIRLKRIGDIHHSDFALECAADAHTYANCFPAVSQATLRIPSEDSIPLPGMQQNINEHRKRPASESSLGYSTQYKRAKLHEALVGGELYDPSHDTSRSFTPKRKAFLSSDSEQHNYKRQKTSHYDSLAGTAGDTIASSIGNVQLTTQSNPTRTSMNPTRVEARPVSKITRNTATARTTLFANANNENARRLVALLRASKLRSKGVAAPSAANTATTNEASAVPTVAVEVASSAPTGVQGTGADLPISEPPGKQSAEHMNHPGKRKRPIDLSQPLKRQRSGSECAREYYYGEAVKSRLGEVLLPSTIAAITRNIWTPSPLAPFQFLRLPAELRNQIYSLVLRQSKYITPHSLCVEEWRDISYGGRALTTKIVSRRDVLPENRPLSILQLNKQIRNEALAVFYSKKYVRLGGLHHVSRFLERIGPDARSLISNLSFTFNKAKGARRAVAMLAECTALEKVHITVDETALVGNKNSERTPILADPERPGKLADEISPLRKVEGMVELHEVKGLKTVVVVVDRPYERLSDRSRKRFRVWLASGMRRPR